MTRQDRLLTLIARLQDGALHRARDLAAHLGVSTRTIWRDMDMLAATGVPIEGTRGAGYRMTAAVSLPPLRLTGTELEALQLGLAVVSQAGDDDLGRAALSLSDKIESALPATPTRREDAWKTALTPFADATRNLTHMPLLRQAVRARQKVRITYTSSDGTVSNRVIRPLRMEHFGNVWIVTGWCEFYNGFRMFRLDLIQSAEALPALFVDEPGKRLEDYAP